MSKKRDALIIKKAFDAFSGAFNVKFFATVDGENRPNIVPVISIIPVDEKTLVFGQLMLFKTRKNLDAGNDKVGFMVVDEALRAWTGIGDFEGFSESGPDMDRLNSLEWIRYNAYTGFKASGRIAVRRLDALGAFSKLDMLTTQTLMPGSSVRRRALNAGPTPPEVIEKFLRVRSVKALAYVGDDGYPRCVPATGVGFSSLYHVKIKLFGKGLEAPLERGAPIALAVITMDPIAYQLKCEVIRGGRTSLVARITRAYSASPPLPGEDLTAIRNAEA